jgi:hypothetical protein
MITHIKLTGEEAPWVSYHDVVDWERQNRSLDGIAAYRFRLFNAGGGEVPESLCGLG